MTSDGRQITVDALSELAILGLISEAEADAEAGRQAARDRSHATLLQIEEGLLAITADPGPLAAGGDLVRDGADNPIPDERVRHRAARALHRAQRLLADQ